MASIPLSQAEVETYRRDGLVVPEYRVAPDLLAEIRAALDRLLAANPESDRNVMICPHLTGHGPGALDGESVWLEWAGHPDFLDMIEQVIGPDILLRGTTIFGKPAGTGQVIPWHQGAPHWPISPPATTSIWIALDACTPENGCLQYIPGSHRGSAGRISIHDTWLVHGSEPNRSDRRRAAFTLRYMSAAAHFGHVGGNEAARRAGAVTDYESRPLYLMRGANTGGSDLAIGHS